MQITITYDIQSLFIQYHEGQGDPLYAVLSRAFSQLDTGRSYRYETTLEASKEEVDRLLEVCAEIHASEPENQEMVDRFSFHLVDVRYPDKEIDCPACGGSGEFWENHPCNNCEATGKRFAHFNFLEESYVIYNTYKGGYQVVDVD